MNDLIAQVLVYAKEMNNWVPVRYLVKHGIHEVNLLPLEDDGLLLVNRQCHDGLLIKLTLKGYHYYSR
jgi:hypothetical protein